MPRALERQGEFERAIVEIIQKHATAVTCHRLIAQILTGPRRLSERLTPL